MVDKKRWMMECEGNWGGWGVGEGINECNYKVCRPEGGGGGGD